MHQTTAQSPAATLDVFQQRRARLLAQLPVNSLLLVASGEPVTRNRDTDYAFRPQSDFFYLTGFAEPQAVLMLKKTSEQTIAHVFLRERDPERETWDGLRLGVASAPAALGVDLATDITQLKTQLPDLLTDMTQVFISYEQADVWTTDLLAAIAQIKRRVRQGLTCPHSISDLDTLLHEDRLIKDAAAQAGLRRAALVTVEGHLAAMRATRPDGYEYQVQAALEHECRRLGATRQAFDSIVASGSHACILHYHENTDRLQAGDLLLIDAGAEVDGYAGDCTHTFPISGQFSPAQAELYDLVLAAQQAALAQIAPYVHYDAAHQAAVKVISQGLIDLELLATKDLSAVIEQQLYKPFYMHQTGHWLGCDVHDVGRYKLGQEWRQLQAGMALTVEPGIYIAPTQPHVADKWRGIGIRIEDSVLVTDQGHEILTQGIPRTRKEIEACMKQSNTIGQWFGKLLPRAFR
jgi:Xaa-Pro aminopeptidase